MTKPHGAPRGRDRMGEGAQAGKEGQRKVAADHHRQASVEGQPGRSAKPLQAQHHKSHQDQEGSAVVVVICPNRHIREEDHLEGASEDVERQIMELDYFAQTRLTRLVLPAMLEQGGGKIVMISSIAGLIGTQYRGAYSAAKAAIHLWANSLRAELYDQGIEVATIFPGFIQTNVSINALTGDGSALGTMDEATSKGLTASEFAKQVVKALSKGEEYIIVGGRQERMATRVNRLSPPKLYKLIRQSQVR